MFDAIDIDDLSSGRFRTMTRKELNQGIPVPGPFHPAIPTEGNLMETSRRSRHQRQKLVGMTQVGLGWPLRLLHQSLTGA